jgi:hypothetical protein
MSMKVIMFGLFVLAGFGATARAQSLTDPKVFDCEWYLDEYPDLRSVFGNPNDAGSCAGATSHWLNSGISEHRRGSLMFDCDNYLTRYASLLSGYSCEQAINHWLNSGINDGRQASREFSVAYYLAHYPDIYAAYCPGGVCNRALAVEHYRVFGIGEGRRGADVEVDGTVPLALHGSTRFSGQGFKYVVFSFPLPRSDWGEHQSYKGLSGRLNVDNRFAAGAWSEMLVQVFYARPAPSGVCPANGTVYSNGYGDFDPAFPNYPDDTPFEALPAPGRKVIQNFIIKAPRNEFFEEPIDLTLPEAVPLPASPACVILLLAGGPIANPQTTTTMAAHLTFKYVPTIDGIAPKRLVSQGGEFCYTVTSGCATGRTSSPTDNSKSFFTAYHWAPNPGEPQYAQVLAVLGNISASTFTPTFPDALVTIPTGAYSMSHETYVVRGTDACQGATPRPAPGQPYHGFRVEDEPNAGDWYSVLPPNPTRILQRVLQLSASPSVAQPDVFEPVSGVTLNPGDCLVTLLSRTGTDGSLTSEAQLRVLLKPVISPQ